jgi:hypothetical protein
MHEALMGTSKRKIWDKFIVRGLLSWFSHNSSKDLLTIFFIRDADYIDIHYLWVFTEILLNLSGIYVFTATDDHLLDSASDLKETIFIFGTYMNFI